MIYIHKEGQGYKVGENNEKREREREHIRENNEKDKKKWTKGNEKTFSKVRDSVHNRLIFNQRERDTDKCEKRSRETDNTRDRKKEKI